MADESARPDVDLLAEICDDPFDEESDYGRGFAAGRRAGSEDAVRDLEALARKVESESWNPATGHALAAIFRDAARFVGRND